MIQIMLNIFIFRALHKPARIASGGACLVSQASEPSGFLGSCGSHLAASPAASFEASWQRKNIREIIAQSGKKTYLERVLGADICKHGFWLAF